jgi:hypothetical protein
MIIDVLSRSPRPVVIHVTGSCRDVAAAGRSEPVLFTRKCAAVYLNAGLGTRDKALQTQLEWNVRYDPPAYAAIFALPCPVYWLPCFETLPQKGAPRKVMEYGAHYWFTQEEILPHLSARMQNYFIYMYAKAAGPDWLRRLTGPLDADLLEKQRIQARSMWCTAGFFHSAGLTVLRDGRTVPLAQAGADALYTFDPVQVSCDPAGVTQWEPARKATNRQILHIRDVGSYREAMTKAMKGLLADLL